MALITPGLAKQRMLAVRRIDLESGDHVFISPPTAGDVLKLTSMEDSDRVLWLLSRILCDEEGQPFYPNGNGKDEIAQWPAEIIQEIASTDFLALDQADAKKN